MSESKAEQVIVELRGAMARGYCHSKNSHKVIDHDLIAAMMAEVLEWHQAALDEARREFAEELCRYYAGHHALVVSIRALAQRKEEK